MRRPYEIVVFFVSTAHHEATRAGVNPATIVRQIDLLRRSAAEREGSADLTVLTDLETDVSGLPASVNVVRRDLDSLPLMLARLTAESAYVEQSELSRPILLCDTDILINGPVGCIFDADFDVGVTMRRKTEMPINSGVRLINNRRPNVSRRFMGALADLVAGRFHNQANWWADQLALNAMVPLNPTIEMPATVIEGDYRVRVLPVSRFSYSPAPFRWATWFPYRSKSILHFKGPKRKPLMDEFFRRHFDRDAGARSA
jgi:hypothetical protein